jgi:phosphosulfolactate synthase
VLAYTDIELPVRSEKPRETGITMMIDWGIPAGHQVDILETCSTYVDLAKIAVGISGLLPRDVLDRKLRAYVEADVTPFPGGMYLEYAICQEKSDYYLATTKALGYPAVEISDNVIRLDAEEKKSLIWSARAEHGLVVLGETGSKRSSTDRSILIEDGRNCLEAGAWKVFVEAAEFFEADDGSFNRPLAQALARELPLESLIFELPGKWIPGIHAHMIHAMMAWLIEELGPEVNIGNVAPEDVVALETLRRGIGVGMKLDGAALPATADGSNG